jgi:hypothetical protein
VTESSDPPGARRGSKRKREPVTLDLKATEVVATEVAAAEDTAPREAPREESSLVDDPRTPEDPPEAASAAQESMPDDPRAEPVPEPTPDEIEAAVERLIPGEGRPGPDIPPVQGIGETSEPPPGPDALDAASAVPAAGGADRIDGRVSDEPAAAPAAMAQPTHRAERRAGLGPLLAAAMLGGLVGAALAVAAERYWLKSADTTGSRLAQIEQRLAAVPPRTDLGPLEQRLSALEPRQRETAQQAQAAVEAARAAERAASRPAEAGSAQPAASGTDPAALERIEARIAVLESQAHGQAEAASQGARGLEDRVTEQGKQIAAIEPRLAEQERRLGEVAARSSGQDQRFAALSGQLGQQLEALARQVVAERRPEATAGLRIVAADRVLAALRDGAPFPEAFAALNRIEPNPQRLSALEPFARSGAPTAGALAQEFKPIAQRILAEARGPATTWGERLERMAEGIVTVRRIGQPGSNDVPGLVARIEDALARGALPDAAAAWDALPEPARRAGEAFGRKLKARAAAEEAARTISNQALAALDAATR